MKLAGHAWTIEHVHFDGDLGIFGRTQVRHSLIEVDADQGVGQERETVMHELLHAVASSASVWTEPEEEERAVRALAPWLVGLLRDNPRLVAYLTAKDGPS